MEVLAIDWGNTAQVTALGLFATGIIAALAAAAVKIIEALNKNTQAVVQGNVQAAAADQIKVAGIQEQLKATPGATPVTVESLPAPSQDPAVQAATVKLLTGTGNGGTLPDDDKLRAIIREEILASINAPSAPRANDPTA